VAAVNESVKESVETVKDWFDISAHAQEHPWLVVGGSVAVGCCLGALLNQTSATPPTAPASIPASSFPTGMQASSNGGTSYARREEPRESQPPSKPMLDLGEWAPELSKLKSLALGVLFSTVRELIVQSVPEYVGNQLKDVIDSATKKVGGDPVPGSELEDILHTSSDEDQDQSEPNERQGSPQREKEKRQPAGRRQW